MQGVFIAFFALFWSAIVLGFDVAMLGESYKQFAAQNYPAVDGTITRSEFTHRSSKSVTIAIAYRYQVNGKTYEGDKLRFGTRVAGDPEEENVVNTHPVGSAVQVFYDPANPRRSLLSPGMRGSDFFFALFMAPFNMVMLGLWIGTGAWLRDRLFHPTAGGVKIISDDMTTRIRLPELSPIIWGLATTGGLGFASVFIVGLATKMQPPLPLASAAVVIVYSSGIAAYFWQRQKVNSGIDDLVLNELSQTLELPLTYGRKERVMINIAGVESLAVEKVEHHSSKGGISYTYAPTLYTRDPQTTGQKLADWSDKRKADEFAEWLRQKLGPHVSAASGIPESSFADRFNPAPPPVTSQEIHPYPGSRIQITDGPNGKEFYFPAARNIGAAMFVTVFAAIFNGGVVAVLYFHGPFLLAFALGIFGILMLMGTFGAWCKSTRVTIDSTAVRTTSHYLFFNVTRQISTSEIDRFERRAGMTMNNKVYSDIKLVKRGQDEALQNDKDQYERTGQTLPMARLIRTAIGTTVASSIANPGEAEWLTHEMNRAIGRNS